MHYSSFIHDNSLEAYISLQSETKLYFGFCKYMGLNPDDNTICSEMKLKSFRIHNQWHHACWSFKTSEIGLDQIEISTKLFYDGINVNQGKW